MSIKKRKTPQNRSGFYGAISPTSQSLAKRPLFVNGIFIGNIIGDKLRKPVSSETFFRRHQGYGLSKAGFDQAKRQVNLLEFYDSKTKESWLIDFKTAEEKGRLDRIPPYELQLFVPVEFCKHLTPNAQQGDLFGGDSK